MKLWINGDSLEVPSNVSTVTDLLRHFGLEGKLAVVERNLAIVDKEAYSATPLGNGDRIEIVHFVGGG